MKTSNILLITAITLGIAVTFVLFLVSINQKDLDMTSRFVYQQSPLSSFSVVVALGNTEFNVECSDTNLVRWRVPLKNTGSVEAPKMFVRNDTLFVGKTSNRQRFENRVVVLCKSLKAVSTTKNDLIELRRLTLKTLDIRNQKSQIYVNNWGDQFSNTLDLNILATDSAGIDLYNVKVSRLKANLDSRAALATHEKVEIAEAAIKRANHSSFSFELMPFKMVLESDTTTFW